MIRILSLLVFVCISMTAFADNFVLSFGETSKFFVTHADAEGLIGRADRLLTEDYHEVFGSNVSHTAHIEDARIIACRYDDPALRRYAKIRGINFEALHGLSDAYIVKVHNNGSQLFIVGSDDRGVAFGMMHLSHEWGVSPFRWWDDAPALPLARYELDVVYERMFLASVPHRTLILEGAQPQDRQIQDLVLRLRATDLVTEPEAVVTPSHDCFEWSLYPKQAPYLGLNLALDHPERIRLEALRAFDRGLNHEWRINWKHQFGGELQVALFFDLAWDINAFRDDYSIDRFVDLHFTQMSGIASSWSQLWNDYFDLAMNFDPSRPLSVESLRRGIGESQSLALQLSLELNDKVVKGEYNGAFFRTIEYPLNMLTSQMQRLCNMQLVRHGMGTRWSIDDCTHRMSLLASELNDRVSPFWRQMIGGVLPPLSDMEQSLRCADGQALSIGDDAPLAADETNIVLYRSTRAVGTKVSPFEALTIPLNHQSGKLRLLIAFLPVRSYGKHVTCMVSVDNCPPRMVNVDLASANADHLYYSMDFDVDAEAESHTITFRTTSDGVYLQRMWLQDMQPTP